MPDELDDRMQEGCEPLVCIADALDCGGAARAALVRVLTAERLDSAETVRLTLLRDARTVFAKFPEQKEIATETLIEGLTSMEEAPWSDYYGRGPIQPREVATLLKHFNIHSTNIYVAKDKRPKGYKRKDFVPAWKSYLSTARVEDMLKLVESGLRYWQEALDEWNGVTDGEHVADATLPINDVPASDLAQGADVTPIPD
jgi:hypothetical protein